ncbi:hypothetical protein CLPUN_05000 [Clostridium puniceum]|uniref:Uncharacterized protein n=1 Tax=Clostridium puniceum TaxID=29367 RepID=A0A1S8TX12_9CLOT|nr:hypothetical protein CLPUN_05000 [Clostridium puniceum]
MFEFKSFDLLTDGEIDLKLDVKIPSNDIKDIFYKYSSI